MDILNFIDSIDMDDVDYMDTFRDTIHRERVNPFEYYDEVKFRKRYRFSKNFGNKIVDLVKADLPCDARGQSLSPQIQVACALRCWARHQVKYLFFIYQLKIFYGKCINYHHNNFIISP